MNRNTYIILPLRHTILHKQIRLVDKRYSLKFFLLVAGALFLAVSFWISPNEDIQQLIFLITIIVAGIPHGSLDYYIEKKTLQSGKQSLTLYRFLAGYLLKMVTYGILWIALPTLALIVFIGLTAYHFGEIDWPSHKRSRTDSILYTLYGLQLILFLIIKNIAVASPILEVLVRNQITSDQWILWGTTALPFILGTIVISTVLLIIFHTKIGWTKSILFQFLAQTSILFSILYTLPLYLSFSFYFGLWHSFLSFNLIRKQLSLSNDSTGWLRLAKLALPFTVVAWLGIVALLSLQTNSTWLLLSNLFIIIAILTLPHNLVFTRIRV